VEATAEEENPESAEVPEIGEKARSHSTVEERDIEHADHAEKKDEQGTEAEAPQDLLKLVKSGEHAKFARQIVITHGGDRSAARLFCENVVKHIRHSAASSAALPGILSKKKRKLDAGDKRLPANDERMDFIKGEPQSDSLTTASLMFVDNKYIGNVIGKKGANVQEIEQISNAKVQVARTENQTLERKVVFRGQVDHVAHAVHLVLCRVWESMMADDVKDIESMQRTTMVIPNQVVGSVIGRGGESVKAIEKDSGATLKIASQDSVRDDSLGRQLELIGTVRARSYAHYLITTIVAQKPEVSDNWTEKAGAPSPFTLRTPAASGPSTRGKGGKGGIPQMHDNREMRYQGRPQHDGPPGRMGGGLYSGHDNYGAGAGNYSGGSGGNYGGGSGGNYGGGSGGNYGGGSGGNYGGGSGSYAGGGGGNYNGGGGFNYNGGGGGYYNGGGGGNYSGNQGGGVENYRGNQGGGGGNYGHNAGDGGFGGGGGNAGGNHRGNFGGGNFGGGRDIEPPAELEIFVSNSIVARLIGIGGAVVREIEGTSGAKVDIEKHANQNGDRMVKLTGSVQACRAAEAMIATKLQHPN